MVNHKLMQPQEVEVLYVLPAIRRELALEMKKKGLEQKKIAGILCVTEAAVSQYVRSKRACKVCFDKKSLEAIKAAASKIKDSKSMISETQKLLQLMRKLKITCKVHKYLVVLPANCRLCSP